MAQFIYLNHEKISVKSISQLHKIPEEDKVKLMVFTGKDASKMANVAMCEIYGKITKGDNIYLDDIKKNLAKKY